MNEYPNLKGTHRTNSIYNIVILLASILSTLLLSAPAFASHITEHSVSMSLDESGAAHSAVTMYFDSLTSEEIYYLVLAEVSGFSASDSHGTLNCKITSLTYGTQISCEPSAQLEGPPYANYSVKMSFDMLGLRSKSAEAYSFSHQQVIRVPTESLKVKLTLPEGTGLVKGTEGFVPYHPENAVIGSSGRAIDLSWAEKSPELGKTYSFSTMFEDVSSIKTPAVTRKQVAAAAAVLAILAALLHLIRSRRKREEHIKAVYSVLTPSEKSVIDIVAGNGGKCNQRKIVRETDFSKAKVSRLISDLEERGILGKERTGRTNLVVLADKTVIKKKPAEESGEESKAEVSGQEKEKPLPEPEKKKSYVPFSKRFSRRYF